MLLVDRPGNWYPRSSTGLISWKWAKVCRVGDACLRHSTDGLKQTEQGPRTDGGSVLLVFRGHYCKGETERATSCRVLRTEWRPWFVPHRGAGRLTSLRQRSDFCILKSSLWCRVEEVLDKSWCGPREARKEALSGVRSRWGERRGRASKEVVTGGNGLS